MTELEPEPLPLVPYSDPGQIAQYASRIAFMAEVLPPDGHGDTGAIFLPADHDGDEIPETLELVLTERQVWQIYRDEVLLPRRKLFLGYTPSGRTIAEHLRMINHLGEWADKVRRFERVTSLDPEPEPDAHEVAVWAATNLGLDIENAYRAEVFIDEDDDAAATVADAIAKLVGAYQELQAVTLILMAVPQLQMGRHDQTLKVEDENNGLWKISTIIGDGKLRITHKGSEDTFTQYRDVSIEDLLAWNDLHFVPDQASGVRDVPEDSLKA